MGLVRWTSTALAVALAVANGAVVAEAQGNICLDLESRLIQINRGAGLGGDTRQYDAPVAQQRNEIDRAMAEARRAACLGGFFIFQRKPEPKCEKLMMTIKQMQGNLQRLMAARGRDGNDPFMLARERNDVLRQLSMNRCGSTYASNENQIGGGGLFESLFGNTRLRTFGDGGFSEGLGGLGTFRTLCVRTCDGFYFPISFSTVPGQFSADAETCAAMCPGAEATLYTHRNPGEDASQMVSLSGEPYTSLPTAFRFRQEFDKTCTCRGATQASTGEFADFTPNGSIELAPDAAAVPVVVPVPNLRPVPGEDPETIANRAGKLVPGPVQPVSETDVSGLASDGQKKIRVVGPAYFYGQ